MKIDTILQTLFESVGRAVQFIADLLTWAVHTVNNPQK